MANPLVTAFSRLFKVGGPNDLAVVVGTDDQALPPVARTTEYGERRTSGSRSALSGEEQSRFTDYALYRQIDRLIPEFSRALTIIATNATAGERGSSPGFKLDFDLSLPEQDRQIVTSLTFDRLALNKRSYSIIRSVNKMGDFFAETVVDDQGLIWRLRYLRPELTHRVHDEYDRHLGFQYKGYTDKATNLEWWRAIHLKHDPEEGDHYGHSLFMGGGKELADSLLAVRRALTQETLSHASAQHLIAVGYPLRMSSEDRDDWIDDLKEDIYRDQDILDNSGVPNLYRRAKGKVAQHILMPFPIDIDGRANAPIVFPLKNAPIGDIRGIAEHFQDLTFVVTGVPKAFFGVERAGEGVGSTRLDKQDLQFARQLRRDQEDFAWFVLEVVRRQFIFLRRQLRADMVAVHMPDLREVDKKLRAEITQLSMQSVKLAIDAGLPPRYVWMEIVFDGDYDAAQSAATSLKIDFDAPFVTAAQATARANRGDLPASQSSNDPLAPDMPLDQRIEDLQERGRLFKEMFSLAHKPSIFWNDAVSPKEIENKWGV